MRTMKHVILMALAGSLVFGAWSGSAFAEAVTETASETASKDTDSDGKIASSAEMTSVDDVVEDWMVPITAENIQNGAYDVEVLSSSSMFNITEALLVVGDDSMSVKMTMGGDGYMYVYPGTPEEAVAADESEYIAYEENDEGKQTYTIPVKAVDEGFKCAAFSKKKQKWYDRTLCIPSYSLPNGAVMNVEMTTLEELGLEDGEYTVDALLQGGSGKASISSPAVLKVEDGRASLEVIFSSPHYDYMIVGDEKYEPVNEEGNSTFIIPVEGFDYSMPVTADTTAMSKPHEIEYTIQLDSASIK